MAHHHARVYANSATCAGQVAGMGGFASWWSAVRVGGEGTVRVGRRIHKVVTPRVD